MSGENWFVVIVVILVAVALVAAYWWRRAAPLGGAAAPIDYDTLIAAEARGGDEETRGGDEETPREATGAALRKYARSQLLEGAAVGIHPLGAEHYTGGGVAVAVHPLDADHYTGGAKAKPKKPWAEYKTWNELHKDPGAVEAYMAQRSKAIETPDFDWTAVLATIQPKLSEAREYIGILSVGADGRTLHVAQVEASPIAAGKSGSETTFAAIPAELVAIHATRPGLFIFHTHPSDPRCCPLPSSHDLAAAIYFGALAKYAANVIISRYGVFSYGLDWSAYKAIAGAKDPQLAALNYSHDVVAAHEAQRSWAPWKLADYLAFYPRHRLFINSYPSPAMVADTRQFTYTSSLESPIDHDLITEHGADIAEHRRGRRRSNAARRSGPLRSLHPAAPIIFDAANANQA